MSHLLKAIFGEKLVNSIFAWAVIVVGAILLVVVGILLGMSLYRWLAALAGRRKPGAEDEHPLRAILSPLALGVFGALLLLLGIWLMPKEGEVSREQTIAAIQAAGEEVQFDETAPDKPIVSVIFSSPAFKVTDGKLQELRGCLEPLPALRHIKIGSANQVSDGGLQHLRGLRQLKSFVLYSEEVTEGGMSRLREALPGVQIDLYQRGLFGNYTLVPPRPPGR